jgi:hypothetical protein
MGEMIGIPCTILKMRLKERNSPIRGHHRGRDRASYSATQSFDREHWECTSSLLGGRRRLYNHCCDLPKESWSQSGREGKAVREDSKLARIRQAIVDGDWDAALKLASRFQRLGEHAEPIRRAANSIINPAMYEQLGYDLAKLKAEGIAALKERYSKSWDEAKKRGST